MLLIKGNRYLFLGRYAFAGTVVDQTPTHVLLGDDAVFLPGDIGGLEEWAAGTRQGTRKVPGQVVCMLGTDATPIPPDRP